MLKSLHHIAIICFDYEVSKRFYTEVLGFEIIAEHYRSERQSYKLDLSLNGRYAIELFSFPNSPKRLSSPEAQGLRHLAFSVDDLDKVIAELSFKQVKCKAIRIDEYSGARFTFFADPDGLPIELVEE